MLWYQMARAATKFCGPSSKLLLLIVPAFIMLSEAVVTEKTGSCYWCGPLAEQVHRSRRAPPCDAAGNHVTTCDPDLPHCAIVATSPPYVESRLCVKIYQDECYPLFCNSTKTWKMTCPCRGDLCNGPNTLREEEAFAILAKLVTKTRTTRIKKRTQQNVAKFFPINDQKTTIITNVSEVENNELNDNLLINTTNDDITQIMLGDAPINSDEENEKMLESTEVLPTADGILETTEKIEVSRIKYIMTSSDTNDDILKGLEVLTHKLINNPVKPSEELPTAEALQQNSSPKASSEKTVVTTTTLETTIDTTTEASVQTTSPDFESKNNGQDILYKTYVLLHFAAFCLHYVSSYYVM